MNSAQEVGNDVQQSFGLEQLLTLTDRLVSWTPSRLESFLNRPVTAPRPSSGAACARIVRGTLIASLTLFVLLAVVHLLNALAWDGRYPSLDADDDQSVWSWASVATESAAAAVLGLLFVTSSRSAAIRFCAVVVLFLSLDDFIRIHEKLGAEWSLFPHAVRTLWPVLYLPLLGVLFIQMWRVAQGFDRVERALIRGGLLALVVAVGVEALTPLLFAIGQGHGSPGYEIEVAVEEGLELAGWIWIAGGLTAGLERRNDSADTGTGGDR